MLDLPRREDRECHPTGAVAKIVRVTTAPLARHGIARAVQARAYHQEDRTEESPMSSDPQVERCLSSIRELSGALSRDVAGLSAEQWDTVTNCAPWRVRDLVAHIVSSGEGFAASI